MSVELNHTIVWCRDTLRSSAFMAERLGRSAPVPFLHFMVVTLDNGVSLDFMEKDGEAALQHYAFLVGEEDFAAVLGRIRAAGLDHWADPACTRRARSMPMMAAAASISPIRTAICSRSSRALMAADSRRNI